MNRSFDTSIRALAAVASLVGPSAFAQESDEDLAKKSLNPVSAMISLPLKLDHDRNVGPGDNGEKTVLTVQPVVPFTFSPTWNLISRTLIPFISQSDVSSGSGTQSGLGDITQQLYFSPKAPTDGGWIWGVGPQMLIRSGSDDLSAEKWGFGPTAVLLKQANGWTYGALANHMEAIAGEDSAPDLSATYLQPFLSYTTKGFTTYGVNTESTYNWETRDWSVPLNVTISQLLKLGGQPLTLQAGVRYWLESPDAGPEGLGFRLQLTFLFPK